MNMIFDGEKWDNTGEIKKSDEEKVFFQMTLLDRVKIGRDACIPKKSKDSSIDMW